MACCGRRASGTEAMAIAGSKKCSARWRRRGSRGQGAALPGSFLASHGELFDIDQLRGVVAGVAGVAVFVLLVVADGFAQTGQREISDGIGLDEFADLFHGVVARDQLAAG